jgi:hypothetical protein
MTAERWRSCCKVGSLPLDEVERARWPQPHPGSARKYGTSLLDNST